MLYSYLQAYPHLQRSFECAKNLQQHRQCICSDATMDGRQRRWLGAAGCRFWKQPINNETHTPNQFQISNQHNNQAVVTTAYQRGDAQTLSTSLAMKHHSLKAKLAALTHQSTSCTQQLVHPVGLQREAGAGKFAEVGICNLLALCGQKRELLFDESRRNNNQQNG